jgi:hypothetical protein
LARMVLVNSADMNYDRAAEVLREYVSLVSEAEQQAGPSEIVSSLRLPARAV